MQEKGGFLQTLENRGNHLETRTLFDEMGIDAIRPFDEAGLTLSSIEGAGLKAKGYKDVGGNNPH